MEWFKCIYIIIFVWLEIAGFLKTKRGRISSIFFILKGVFCSYSIFTFLRYNSFVDLKVFFPLLIALLFIQCYLYFYKFKLVGVVKGFLKKEMKESVVFYYSSIIVAVFALYYSILYSIGAVDFVLFGLLSLFLMSQKKILNFFYAGSLLFYFSFNGIRFVSQLFFGDEMAFLFRKFDFLTVVYGGAFIYTEVFCMFVVCLYFLLSFLKKGLSERRLRFNRINKYSTIAFALFLVFSSSVDDFFSLFDKEKNEYAHDVVFDKGRLDIFEPKKNIVIVYFESFNSEFLEVLKSQTSNLNRVKKDALFFSDYNQQSSSTIHSMKNTLCFDVDEGGKSCLGDKLGKAGYLQKYIGGANALVSRKDLFYNSQGYNMVVDKTVLSEDYDDKDLLPPFRAGGSSWGYSDNATFDYLFKELKGLDSETQNFNLTMLTIDTHDAGIYSKVCDEEKDDISGWLEEPKSFENNIACSDYLFGKFFDKIHSLKRFKDTVFVFVGDHPNRRSDTMGIPLDDRRTLLMIYNSGVESGEMSDRLSMDEFLPTILKYIS